MSLIDSKWLKENNYHLFHYEPMGNGKEGVVEVDADAIPTTWIPCSERLPELSKTKVDYKEVLCIDSDGEVEIITYTNRNPFWAGMITDPWWDCPDYVRVMAWMELPTDRPKEVQP